MFKNIPAVADFELGLNGLFSSDEWQGRVIAAESEKYITGKFCINEQSGEKYLDLSALAAGLHGRLFRQGTVDGKAIYRGFLKPFELNDINRGEREWRGTSWMLEISAVGSVDTAGVAWIKGRVFDPRDAAKYSADQHLVNVGMPF